MEQEFKKRSDCRSCGSKDLASVLDFGSMPPANAFVSKENIKSEKAYPLTAVFCRECKLFQVPDVVSPGILFGYYAYLTSASSPMHSHFSNLAAAAAQKFGLKKGDLAVDIGGNDGLLLESLLGTCATLNIEPAENVASISRRRGIETVSDFFSSALAADIVKKYGHAKVCFANNVLAHIDGIRDIFDGLRTLIGGGGVLVFEVHWLGNLLGEGGFDQIYHEHLCYYSLTSLKHLVESSGLKIFDVEMIPVHGESMRVYAARNRPAEKSVGTLLVREKEMKLDDEETFKAFRDKVERNKKDIIGLLAGLKRSGARVACYGAPAKGNTLLNFCGINSGLVEYITDTTPFKQGLFTPGTHIPVYSPEKLLTDRPDYLLLLAWNYAETILKKESGLIRAGTKFILPVPEPKIL